MKHSFLILLLLHAIGLPVQASKHRGVWFWREAGNPWGSDSIVGVPALESQTISFLSSKSVRRVYGSYGDRPVMQASVIAAWNVKLQASGMESQSLMSENTWIFAANRPTLLSHITTRLLNFNNTPGRTPAEKFDALHLDIEPHALPAWATLTSAQKRSYLLLLRDTYVDVRAHFVAAGQPNFPVYADLPVWFDNLPVDPGDIGWLSVADRDQWFADIAVPLTGITLMPFDRLTFSSINNGVTWERANVSGAVVRCGIEADIGIGATWPSVPNFNAMMETMESAYGPGGAVDIQSYRQWREAIALQPIIIVDAVLQKGSVAAATDLVFPAEANWTQIVLYSPDLCVWQELRRYTTSASGEVRHPVDLRASRGFWQVAKFQELE